MQQTLPYLDAEPLKPTKHILLGETITSIQPYDCSIEWPYNSVGTGMTIQARRSRRRWRYFDLKGVRAHRTKNVLFVDANVRPPPRPPIDLCGRDPYCDPTVFSLPPCREGIPCQDKWPREDYKEYVDYDLDFTN